MDDTQQIIEISNYFKQNETKEIEFKMGVEFEYFIIDCNTLETISYYGKHGVQDILEQLSALDYKPSYEGKHILGVQKGSVCVTLEPGSQFEVSIGPLKEIREIEQLYNTFLHDLIPILEQHNYALIACGYQPETSISSIKMIPKKRYEYMFNYFKTCGTLAHNMMKGSASVQYSFDYKSEEDYVRKFRVSNLLSPILYALFDNSPIFEGKEYEKHGLRANIWQNCDLDRCGIVEGALNSDFNYDAYSKYILTRSPILTLKGDRIKDVKGCTFKHLFNPKDYTNEELEHVLTMCFPDVRTKKFIEIRMIDSIPYPMNFAALALLKGILYNDVNLTKVDDCFKGVTYEELTNTKLKIIEQGIQTVYNGNKIIDHATYLLQLASDALDEGEHQYLTILKDLVLQQRTPAMITKERLRLGMNKKEALNWCIVTNKNQNRGDCNEQRPSNKRVCEYH